MSIKVRERKLLSGEKSLYLDIYINGRRRYESLNLIIGKDRTKNKENRDLAESIRSKTELDIKHSQYGLIPTYKSKGNFVTYFKNIVDNKSKSERAWGGAYKHLNKFTKGTITFREIDEKWLEDFKVFLFKAKSIKTQNTAHTYFTKIVAALNQAVKEKIILNNPSRNIKKIGIRETERIHLSIEEIQKLSNTECKSKEVKRAFLFACFTGLRFSDIKNLTWSSIKNNQLEYRQQKTDAFEYLPLHKVALNLILENNVYGLPNVKVFNLPNSAYTNKVLKTWADDAEIGKKIYFHVSRHSFSTMSLTHGARIEVVSKLLGHKKLSTTQIYAKIVDEKKREAIDLLPDLKIGV